MSKPLISKEQLLNKMKELTENNILETSKKNLALNCGFKYPSDPYFSKYLKELEEENKIILKQKAIRNSGSGNGWRNYIWEIVNIVSDNKEIIKVNNYIEESFNNIIMKLYKTEKGYVIPIVDIARVLKIDRQSIHDLINRNKELFESFIVSVILTSPKSGNENTCLTKDGVIGLLMKISYTRLPEEKQKLVLDFQKWAIEKLTMLISDGEVKLSKKEHTSIQNNISEIIGMTEEDIDKLFNNIDEEMAKIINTAKSSIKKLHQEKQYIEYEKEILKKENQKWINNTLALKQKLYSLNSF